MPRAPALNVLDLLSPLDIHKSFREFFTFDRKISYSGHYSPIMAVQVTELADGFFIGISVNHAITDGTSFWNFFDTFAQNVTVRERICVCCCWGVQVNMEEMEKNSLTLSNGNLA
ncbi:hypothetical protein HN51_035446 [Arachis hypogaea]